MKNPSICKSECNTWYVIAVEEKTGDHCVVYESYRRKDCRMWLETNFCDNQRNTA